MFTPEGGEHGQDAHDADHREDRPARERQQRPHPGPARPADLARIAHALGSGLVLQPPVDGRLRELPHEIRQQERQADIGQRAGHARSDAAGREAHQVEVPQVDDRQAPAAVTTMWTPRRRTGRKLAPESGPRRPAGLRRPRGRAAGRAPCRRAAWRSRPAGSGSPPGPCAGGRPAARASGSPGGTGRRPSSGPARGRPAAGGGCSARRRGSWRRSAPDAPDQAEEHHDEEEPPEGDHQEVRLTGHAEALEEEVGSRGSPRSRRG